MNKTIERREFLRFGPHIGLWMLTPSLQSCAVTYLSNIVGREENFPVESALPTNELDDQSHMNRVHLAQIIEVPSGEKVRQLIKTTNSKISIGGTRHSQGQQSLLKNSIHLRFQSPENAQVFDLSLDKKHYKISSAATWGNALDLLSLHGRSVKVMQSNNDFSIGGSISVNSHGWQTLNGPVGSTVKSIELVTSSGELVRCSRESNSELFSLAVGGFGMFGTIINATLESVPNEIYAVKSSVMDSEDYETNWYQEVRDIPTSRMSYGRLRISEKKFLEVASLNAYYFDSELPANFQSEKSQSGYISNKMKEYARAVFRGSEASEYGKRLRWDLENLTGAEHFGSKDRNSILNRSSKFFANRNPSRTDILFETFLPRSAFNAFVCSLKTVLPQHKVDLLNITVRDIEKDDTAFLNYARFDAFAFVFFFNIGRNKEDDLMLKNCIREIIDAALELNGSFYLPYRRYATLQQVERAYPMLNEFIRLKNKYDPQHRFDSEFARHYGIT